MIDPDLMTDTDGKAGLRPAYEAIALLVLTFAAGFGLGWLVAWL